VEEGVVRKNGEGEEVVAVETQGEEDISFLKKYY
jgi:hypothetical protein